MNSLHRLPISIAVLLLLMAAVMARAEDQVADLIESVRTAETPDQRTEAFYSLVSALERGRIELNADEAAPLAELLVEVLLDPDSQHERLAAAQMMEENAHPLMADPLSEYLAENPDLPRGLKRTIGLVLARLHDERVFDAMIADLQDAEVTQVTFAIDRLVELGDPHAVVHLEALRADTTLVARFAEGLVERRRQNGNDTNPEAALRSGRRDAEKARAAAGTAIRQLNLKKDFGVVCGFDLGESALAVLAEQGFVILPHPKNEMYELYDKEYPFVTTDFTYHTAMILVRAVFDELENGLLRDMVAALSLGLAQASSSQAQTLASESDVSLARRNAAFFAVPAILCGATTLDALEMDQDARDAVTVEIGRIEEADGLEPSPLLGVKEDYTSYRPRGRFSQPGVDAGYFQAVTWLARGGFPVQEERATRRALLITAAIAADTALAGNWHRLDEVYSLLAGEADDPTLDDYQALAENVSGRQGLPAVQAVLDDEDLESAFSRAAAAFPAPRIHTGTDADRAGALGLRVLGQRYSRDAHVFQNLLEVGIWPPSGLHVLAGLLGSERAEHYLGTKIALPQSIGKENGPSLMDGYLDCFSAVLEDDARLPGQFRTSAWQDKQLNNALGGWAETRHAAAPYLKAAHTYAGISAMTDRLHGFVEPYPEFFTRLSRRMANLHDLLERLDLYGAVAREKEELEAQLDKEFGPANKYGRRTEMDIEKHREYYEKSLQQNRLDGSRLPAFTEILDRLAVLAVKCRDGVPQDPGDGVFLKGLGHRMRNLSFNHSSLPVAEKSMARVIDVATEYLADEVLEAGVGQALPIYVAVPDGEQRIVCRGAVYSYYEFVVPVDRRLDDDTWACLASRLAGPGEGPWVESGSGLLHRPTLDRAEIIELKNVSEDGFGRNLVKRRPWSPRVDRHFGVDPWVGARASEPATEVLIDLASGDDIAGSVQLFATEELFRIQAQDSRARDFFRQTVNLFMAEAEPRRPFRNTSDNLRMFLAVQVLAGTGASADRTRLDEVSAWIDTWPTEYPVCNEWAACYRAALSRTPAEGYSQQ